MKNIIFIAPPAAGKGTMSELLIEKYGYIHISTGDILRGIAKSGTELGDKVDKYLVDFRNNMHKVPAGDPAFKGYVQDSYKFAIHQRKDLLGSCCALVKNDKLQGIGKGILIGPLDHFLLCAGERRFPTLYNVIGGLTACQGQCGYFKGVCLVIGDARHGDVALVDEQAVSFCALNHRVIAVVALDVARYYIIT